MWFTCVPDRPGGVLSGFVPRARLEPLKNHYRHPARYWSPGTRDMTHNNRPGVRDPCG
jgi:hypothetical protein